MKNEENSNRPIINETTVVRNNEKKVREDAVKKGVITTAIIAFVLLIAVGITGYSLYNHEHKKQLATLENQKHTLTEQISTRDSVIGEWLLTFDQIERDLNIVKEKENIITINSSDVEFSKDKKQQILEDIKYINTLLDQNKKKINSLTAQLAKSGGTIKGLQIKLAALEESIKLRETEISDLKVALVEKDFEIGQLNTLMTDQQVLLAQKDEKISLQTGRINKAFLVSGTYKALKEKGIVSKEGGFLGLGKKESFSEDFDDSSFTQINIAETFTIPVNSKAAKLITTHPTSSYELIRDDNNKIAYIAIKDPDQFWKISKYAVVEIKN